MNSHYTAGELAKLAGVSSRTIRYYDNKGILKPVSYSEGAYRLYDETSIVQLQKIIMLKYVGFSLEEIEKIIAEEKNENLSEILWRQKLLLMQKRETLNGIIHALDDAIGLCGEKKDNAENLDKISQIMKLTAMEEAFNQRISFYEKYSKRQQEWHPWVFAQMKLAEGMHILDMSCGHGLVWTRNWKKIPANTTITVIDKLSRGIDYLENFYIENQRFLQPGVTFRFIREDLEKMENLQGTYDRIVANHLWSFVVERKALMHKVKAVLKKETGFMVSTMSAMGVWETIKHITKNDSIRIDFSDILQKKESQLATIEKEINEVFAKTKVVYFNNDLVMDDAKILMDYMKNTDKDVAVKLQSHEKELEKCIVQHLQQNKELHISNITPVYCCR